MRLSRLALALAAALAATSAAAAPDPAAGRALLDLRLRGEWVDDAAFADTAQALTLRARVGYRTPERHGWRAVVALEATGHLGDDAFNSTRNGETTRPIVADPDNVELDQAWVQYQPRASLRLAFGRQPLLFDNQRFFGASAWRQNEQTFDAVDAQFGVGKGSVRYAWLDRVQRIYGGDHPNPTLRRWNLDAHLLELAMPLGPGTLSGYGHWIDNRTLPATSHRNLGVRYVAKRDVPAGWGWQLAAEFATQRPYADGSAAIDADYRLVEGALVRRGHSFKAGYEVLGGDGTYAFQTPFATLHAFDGWADKFLTTPPDGLADAYVGWSHKFGAVAVQAVAHDFRSDHDSRHYGREWDASAAWAFRPGWNAMFKVADYQADGFARDTRKVWASVEYAY